MSYARQFDVESLSSSKHRKSYVVSQRHDGNWECSCPAWCNQSPRRDCKHILSIKVELMQANQSKQRPQVEVPVLAQAATASRRFR